MVGGVPGFAALSQEAESTALGSVSLFLLFRIFFFFFFFFLSNFPTPMLASADYMRTGRLSLDTDAPMRVKNFPSEK